MIPEAPIDDKAPGSNMGFSILAQQENDHYAEKPNRLTCQVSLPARFLRRVGGARSCRTARSMQRAAMLNVDDEASLACLSDLAQTWLTVRSVVVAGEGPLMREVRVCLRNATRYRKALAP